MLKQLYAAEIKEKAKNIFLDIIISPLSFLVKEKLEHYKEEFKLYSDDTIRSLMKEIDILFCIILVGHDLCEEAERTKLWGPRIQWSGTFNLEKRRHEELRNCFIEILKER